MVNILLKLYELVTVPLNAPKTFIPFLAESKPRFSPER